MDERTWLFRYAAIGLAITGGIEWLLGWTISRMAAAPTLEGTPRSIIETLGRFGLFFIAPSFILATVLCLLSVVSFGSEANKQRSYRRGALAIYLAVFVALTALLSFLPAEVWLATMFNLLAWLALWAVAIDFLMTRGSARLDRVAVLLVALAYSGWYYYVLQQGELNRQGGSTGAPLLVLDLGEMLAVITPFVLFSVVAAPHSQWRHPKRWILPAVLTLLFSAGSIADMAAGMGFTGVFAKWSLGFSLFLPWPVYALALALFVYSILTCFSKGEKAPFANANTGLGMLLLMFAGYNLQITYQHLLALLSVLLFAGLARPFNTAEDDQRLQHSLEPAGADAASELKPIR